MLYPHTACWRWRMSVGVRDAAEWHVRMRGVATTPTPAINDRSFVTHYYHVSQQIMPTRCKWYAIFTYFRGSKACYLKSTSSQPIPSRAPSCSFRKPNNRASAHNITFIMSSLSEFTALMPPCAVSHRFPTSSGLVTNLTLTHSANLLVIAHMSFDSYRQFNMCAYRPSLHLR